MKFTQYPEPAAWDYTVMEAAADAILRAWSGSYSPEANQHHWWLKRYYNRSTRRMHPVVDAMRKAWRPLDWQKLLLEWPYVAESDPSKIAYTQSEAHGQADRQTVTNIGKYLNRHWPHVADHIKRDAVAAYSCDDMEILKTREGIIYGIEYGPRSCMQSGYGSIPFDESDKRKMGEWLKDKSLPEPRWEWHPYAVYAPELGWGMATRKKEGVVLGRGLVLEHEGEKCFVRTYNRRSDEEYSSSSSDHVMEEWLRAQGYTKRDRWPDGARMLKLTHPTSSGPMMPYIDGCDSDARRVNLDGEHFAICYEDGKYLCGNTNGEVGNWYGGDEDDEEEDTSYCESCESSVPSDDITAVGRDGDEYVCTSCQEDRYTLVRGARRSRSSWRNYSEYYLRNGDVAEVVNQSYEIDNAYPPEDVVMLHDGDWAETDDTVYIDGEYYMHDDDDVCELENEWDGERYALKDNCWQCDGTGNWYHEHDTDEQVEIGGETYHQEFLTDLLDTVPDGSTLSRVKAYLRRDGAPVPAPVPAPSPAPETVPGMPAGLWDLCQKLEPYSAKAVQWISENWTSPPFVSAGSMGSGIRLDCLMSWIHTPQGWAYWNLLNCLVSLEGTADERRGWLLNVAAMDGEETVPETEPVPAGMPENLETLCRQIRAYSAPAAAWIEANWSTFQTFSSLETMRRQAVLDLGDLMIWEETPQGANYWGALNRLVDGRGNPTQRSLWRADVVAVDGQRVREAIRAMPESVTMAQVDSWLDESIGLPTIDPAALERLVADMQLGYEARQRDSWVVVRNDAMLNYIVSTD